MDIDRDKLFDEMNILQSKFKELNSYREPLSRLISQYINNDARHVYEEFNNDICNESHDEDNLIYKPTTENHEREMEFRADQFWAFLLAKSKPMCIEMHKIISYVYSIPCSDAFVEGVFSHMKSAWTVRWNSSFKMLERLLSLCSLADEIFAKRDYKGLTSTQEGKLRSLIFTYDDWELLSALRDCLEPFDKATTALSGDYPTQSMSYFIIQSLHENFQHSFNPTYYHAVINNSLYFQSKYYLDEFLPSAQKIGMNIATFLDPVFHGDLIAYKEDYEMAKRVVMDSMQQTDPLAPDATAVLSYDESRNSPSTANTAPIMLFKSNFMNITGKTASAPTINSTPNC
ncbi:unnamed protein product [Rotaria magnacalcarata]|nr:unnamed protein product [Rotaria magnacalcarata]